MKRWGKQKLVRFDEKELKTDLNSWHPKKYIFVGSSCDMFADDIPYEWIKRTLKYCQEFNSCYLFQSKNPIRIWHFLPFIPGRSSICTTIETNRFYPEIMNKCPRPVERSGYMNRISEYFECHVTIEPIMDFDLPDMIALIKHCHPTQVNIGADSGNNHLPEPSKEKILALIDELQKFTKIDRKTNLERLLK
jgi:hypothetical protein